MRMTNPPGPSQSLPYLGHPQPPKKCGECLTALDMEIEDSKARKKAVNNLTRVSTVCLKCGASRCLKKHLYPLCSRCLTTEVDQQQSDDLLS